MATNFGYPVTGLAPRIRVAVTIRQLHGNFNQMSIFDDRRKRSERRMASAVTRLRCRRENLRQRRAADPDDTRPWWLKINYLNKEVRVKGGRSDPKR